MSSDSSLVGASTPENRTAMPGSSRESPLDSLACCLARVRMACLPHQLTREKLAITRRKPKREPLKMNSKDASSENSFLKVELRVGEEKLQLALPTRADVDLDSSARQTYLFGPPSFWRACRRRWGGGWLSQNVGLHHVVMAYFPEMNA